LIRSEQSRSEQSRAEQSRAEIETAVVGFCGPTTRTYRSRKCQKQRGKMYPIGVHRMPVSTCQPKCMKKRCSIPARNRPARNCSARNRPARCGPTRSESRNRLLAANRTQSQIDGRIDRIGNEPHVAVAHQELAARAIRVSALILFKPGVSDWQRRSPPPGPRGFPRGCRC